uniref:NADH dehydrogenase subunit 2 n=1 Tax=Protostrongylus rufescens TaxID=321386 RepID=A0A059SEH4_PRORF|nr:NADH dehydrogenase subunit 2 [Protostrongylus rufescens]AGW80391.1 NADH dehydrogenase subunit 2 [Protostrongylus rufescens]
MYLFLFMLVAMLSLFILLVNNVFFWWGVFLIMTIIVVTINKATFSYSSIFNYFVLQESLGLLFLLLFFSFFPGLLIMFKVGMAPFHFWVFKVVNNMVDFSLVWFLTVHKLPYLLVFIQLLFFSLVFFMILGILMSLLQMFTMKLFKNLLVLSSIESFNWVVIGLIISVFNVLVLFFYYFFLMVMLIFKLSFVNSVNLSYSWELVLAFMNMPFMVGFFIKIFSLMETLKVMGFYMLVLMFMLFLSTLSISFWLIMLSSDLLKFNKYNYFLVMFMIPFMMIVLV